MAESPLAKRLVAARDRLADLERRARAAGGKNAAAELAGIVELLDAAAAECAQQPAVPPVRDRSQAVRLQAVTAALSEALTPAQVAEVLVEQGVSATDAVAGTLALLDDSGETVEIVRADGYAPALLKEWERFALSTPAPLAEAIRSGKPVLIGSAAEGRKRGLVRRDAWPDGRGGALAAVPLIVDSMTIGAIGFSYERPRSFDGADDVFLAALAQQFALALLRARLYQAQRDARAEAEAAQRWLRFLAEAGTTLSATLDYEETLAQVAQLAVPALADWCDVCVPNEAGQVERRAFAVGDPARQPAVAALARCFPIAPDAPHPVARVLRSGRAELRAAVTEADLVALGGGTARLRLLRAAGATSYMCVPLLARGHTIGALTFFSSAPERRYGSAQLALAEEIARRAALAADNARLHRQVQDALAARDRALDAVEAERERLFGLFMQTPAAVVYLRGPEHRVEFVNPGAIRFLGGDPSGRPVREALAPLAAGSGYLHVLDHVFRTGKPYSAPEVRALIAGEHGAREDAFFNIVLQPVREADGAVEGILVHAVEVTAQVQARQQVETLAVENARLYDEARDALRQRDVFFSTVSHDLNTPLTTIKGLAQLLRRRAAPFGPELDWVREGLSSIDAASSRMRALIGQLLDAARLQAGEPLALDRQRVNLAELVREVAEEQRLVATKATIRVETPAPEPVGFWDPVRIERVAGNLISNAIKYSPDGGEIDVRVRLEGEGERACAVLEVEDQGIGIPAADLPQVFERFFRGSNVTGKISGTGIGLAGVRQIVEQHAGTVWVESTEGRGTRFSVRLPLHGGAEEKA
ncbi:MAG TPA: ATP-binding protein [Dehalococcoidia bacterium]|nr:ATP-binding protein [Dehalococcoidia bacterium]